MARNSARTNLTIPYNPDVDKDYQRVLNEKLRTIESELQLQTTATSSGGATTSTGGTIVLSVPGTVAIMSNAAPLVSLPSSITPTEILLLVKQGSIGASLTVRVAVNGTSYATVTAAAGKISASLKSSFGAIAANQLITLDIINVGTTFPGSNVSVLIRF